MATISAHDPRTGRLFTAEILADLGNGTLRVAVPHGSRPNSSSNVLATAGPFSATSPSARSSAPLAFCTVNAVDGTVVAGSYGDSQ